MENEIDRGKKSSRFGPEFIELTDQIGQMGVRKYPDTHARNCTLRAAGRQRQSAGDRAMQFAHAIPMKASAEERFFTLAAPLPVAALQNLRLGLLIAAASSACGGTDEEDDGCRMVDANWFA